ncbi:hypothetical protein GCM10011507_26300 [Edaphobacter acidisoli]|uniref:Uncharacterized protein n=1 Tax=Edaphobacter acidisoli TaxID=2040573 RepID=A0A916RYC9_9BACT|nr:hypothetical protein [Edaphobacter acidisoli]GGA73441.1 hypothetical protein GCM10011507_26300 [Edaphobacter acidisoli]
MAADPIPALQSFGYTDREAAFLYLAAAHSGYFLRRQFDYFTDRNKGSIVMRFLEKAHATGHIESLDYKQGWHVYHIVSRTIYRLLGDPESQLRRRKGDAHVRARLMALDYALENEDDRYLISPEERLHFLAEIRGISPSLFTGEDGALYPLLASFPISLTDRTRPARSPVRFAFVDEGLATVEKFLRFLSVTGPLLRSVGNFEVAYVAISGTHFEDAEATFWRKFADDPHSSPSFLDDDLRPVVMQPRVPFQPRFTTLLLGYSYPILQRSEVRGSARVRS